MIQDLQKKMLEQQEKLAVALKVDRAKDQAISKLREAWTKVTNSLEKAETRHKIMIDKITSEMDQHKMAACDAQKVRCIHNFIVIDSSYKDTIQIIFHII